MVNVSIVDHENADLSKFFPTHAGPEWSSVRPHGVYSEQNDGFYPPGNHDQQFFRKSSF